MLMSEKLLNQANFKSFQPKIVQMGALQSCQIPYKPLQFCGLYMSNQSIQTLYFGWYLKSYHFPPPKTSVRGNDCQIQLIFHLNIL